jgi:hypothetical protein
MGIFGWSLNGIDHFERSRGSRLRGQIPAAVRSATQCKRELRHQRIGNLSAFRNKPLHGFTPAAIHRTTAGDVATWSIPAGPNLNITPTLDIQIDSASLQNDFIGSMKAYASYLASNVDPTSPLSPHDRWKKSFWCRFNPLNHKVSVWEQEGRKR